MFDRADGMSLVVATRGDALAAPLTAALDARWPGVRTIGVDLSQPQRLLVAGMSFRPDRRAWVERLYKSRLAYRLRSRNAARELAQPGSANPLVLQVHALFELSTPSVTYVDCTHRQVAEHWPDWNPLAGQALEDWYAAERHQYHNAEHLFTLAPQAERSLVDDYGVSPERVTNVGAGVNFAQLPGLRRARPEGPPTVLFIGNDWVRKGGPELLRAFALVRRELPDARLQIVGTKHRMVPQPGVEVLGRITDRVRVADLYAGADVFCLLSLFDPYPLVLLEAMAYGLPCVGSTAAGIREIVTEGETGLLVPPGHDEELAAALVRLLSDPASAARLGAQGRERVERELLWSHVVDRMAPALERVAADLQRRRSVFPSG